MSTPKPDRRSQEAYEAAKAVAQGLCDAVAAKEPAERLSALSAMLDERTAQAQSATAQATVILLVVAVMRHQATAGGLRTHEVNRLEVLSRDVMTLLMASGLKDLCARLSAELAHGQAMLAMRGGDAVTASWLGDFALSMTTDSEDLKRLQLTSAASLARRGEISRALRVMDEANRAPASAADAAVALARLPLLRLAGRIEKADEIAHSLASLALTPEQQTSLQWEDALRDLPRSGTMRALTDLVLVSRTHRSAWHSVEAVLWARARGDHRSLQDLPLIRNLRRTATDVIDRLDARRPLVELALALEEADDETRSPAQRLDAMVQAVRDRRTLPTLDQELLVLASGLRWARSHGHQRLADHCLAEYTSLGVVTGAPRQDPLGILARLQEAPERTPAKAASTKARESVGLKRTMQVSRMAAILATRLAANRIRRLTPGDSPERRRLDQEALVALLTQHLTRLKGTFMKLGQLLTQALENRFPNAPFEELRKTYQQGKAISGDEARALMAKELGEAAMAEIRVWSAQPIAVGSFGQVHYAERKDGRAIAVKIQFADASAAAESDLRNLKLSSPLIRLLFPELNLEEIMEEHRQITMGEVDYRAEANHMTRFRELLAGNPDVIVPAVHHDLSTARILTMDYVSGRKLHDFRISASAEQKQKIAQAMIGATIRTFLDHGFFNSDPHPGNYIVVEDRESGRLKLGFVDFGAAKNYDPAFMVQLRELLAAVAGDERARHREIVTALGFPIPGLSFDFDYAFDAMRDLIIKPWTAASFQFTPEFVRQDFERNVLDNPNVRSQNLPSEFLTLLAFNWKLGAVLALLEAEVSLGLELAPAKTSRLTA